jgi:hypothetical protein
MIGVFPNETGPPGSSARGHGNCDLTEPPSVLDENMPGAQMPGSREKGSPMRKIVSSVMLITAVLLLSWLVSGADAGRWAARRPETPGTGVVPMSSRARAPRAPMSEPGSILLIGSGLIGLAHLVRRGRSPK